MFRLIALGFLLVLIACTPKTDVDADMREAVHTELAPVIAANADQSKRLTTTVQEGLANISKVDNSTSDKVVNRLLAAAVGLALLGYSAGKLVWAGCSRLHPRHWRRRRHASPARVPACLHI